MNAATLPEGLLTFLADEFPEFEKLPVQQQQVFVKLALDCVRGKNPHRTRKGATAFFYQDRLEGFRLSADFDRANNLLGWFMVVQAHSRHENIARAIVLDPFVQRKVAAFLRRDTLTPRPLVDWRGSIKRKPPSAILSKDSRGATRKSKGQLESSVVRIDEMALLELKDEYGPDDYPEEVLVDSIVYQSNLEGFGPGHVVLQYRECPHGRLMGIADGTHFQNMPKKIRNAAFNGQYDYDIEVCHPTFIYHIGKAHGLELPSLKELVSDRKKFRNDLVVRHGLDYDTVKDALTALCYGARLSTSPKVELADTIPDREVRRAFCDDPEVKALHRDLKDACHAVITNAETSRGRTRNCLDKWVEGKPATTISHILQGLEGLALDMAIQATGGRISLLVHDGFIAPREVDTDIIEAQFREKTGIPIRYEVESLEAA